MDMKERTNLEASGSIDFAAFELAQRYEEHALTELRSAGYRITMPRVQVIRALADAEVAVSAYAIHEKIIKAGGKIDVVSVYRILSTLLELCLIHHVGLVNGYFPARKTDPRTKRSELVMCECCQRVHELPFLDSVHTQVEGQLQSSGFKLGVTRLELTSSECPKCTS